MIIRFQCREYLLTEGGAITTPEDFENFRQSYAHYYPEKDAIQRFGEKIGTSADFEVLRPYDGMGPDLGAALEQGLGLEWPAIKAKP